MRGPFDYIIVGGGTAGCVLAHRLSADPACQVLLLEAGGEDRHPLLRMPVAFTQVVARPDWNWRLQSQPEPGLHGRTLPVPRGRVLGGSSSINGLFHIRGHRDDFDAWRDAGCTGWGYDDVLPYFRRSEAHAFGSAPHHGVDGPMQVRPIAGAAVLHQPLREAARAAGHAVGDDYDAEQGLGFFPGQVNVDARGRRHSTARAYLHPVRSRRNLTVLTQAHATRVLMDGPRAAGVAYRHAGKALEVQARREVLLCGGAYHSPQLLLLSGIGPGDELHRHGIAPTHELSGVGANLGEHPRMMLMYRASAPVSFLRHLRLDRAVLSALRWGLFGSGPFATQVSSGSVLLRSDGAAQGRPDIQLLCNPVRLDARLWLPGFGAAQEHAFYVTVCLLHAQSRGRVGLHSADPLAAPKIEFNLLGELADVQALRAGLRAARQIYAQAPMAGLIEVETIPGPDCQSDAQIDAAIHQLGGITHHPVGTCAMGTHSGAVVDAQLRVHGLQGLRVVDASIMPATPSGNTHAATVMVAEKAADMILGRSAILREAP